jgi:hypothetical protein
MFKGLLSSLRVYIMKPITSISRIFGLGGSLIFFNNLFNFRLVFFEDHRTFNSDFFKQIRIRKLIWFFFFLEKI